MAYISIRLDRGHEKGTSLCVFCNRTKKIIEDKLITPFYKEKFITTGKGKGFFDPLSQNAKENNKIISSLREEYERIATEFPTITAKELVSFNRSHQEKKKEENIITFEKWVQIIVDDYERNRSTNYLCYNQMKNVVKEVYPEILKKPIGEITNKDFITLGDNIKEKRNGCNYDLSFACKILEKN